MRCCKARLLAARVVRIAANRGANRRVLAPRDSRDSRFEQPWLPPPARCRRRPPPARCRRRRDTSNTGAPLHQPRTRLEVEVGGERRRETPARYRDPLPGHPGQARRKQRGAQRCPCQVALPSATASGPGLPEEQTRRGPRQVSRSAPPPRAGLEIGGERRREARSSAHPCQGLRARPEDNGGAAQFQSSSVPLQHCHRAGPDFGSERHTGLREAPLKPTVTEHASQRQHPRPA